MYKTKLQELCHQYSWNLPDYTTVKDGPDHNPMFNSTVVVNGLTFEVPKDQCRSSKESQNQAAKLAFDHFTAAKAVEKHIRHLPLVRGYPSPLCSGLSTSNINSDVRIMPPTQQEDAPSPQSNRTPLASTEDKRSKDMLHLYKNRLQHYAQKKNITLPEYSCELDGPPHSRRFKSSVTIDGRTFKALEFFSTLRDAEHEAAKVAFESLSFDNFQEDDGLYKNLLQELSQKEGFLFPTYDTNKTGPPHDSTFVSTVEIGGEMFKGGEAKSKKQAEMNAAKAAYTALTERRTIQNSTVLSPGCYILKASGVTSSSVQSIVPYELQPNINPKASLIICEEQAEGVKGGASKNHKLLSPGCHVEEELMVSPSCVQYIAIDDLQQNSRRKGKLVMDEEQETEEKVEHSTSSVVELDTDTAAGAGTLTRSKVIVCPRKSSMAFTDGATELPFSDDKWVALRVDINQSS